MKRRLLFLLVLFSISCSSTKKNNSNNDVKDFGTVVAEYPQTSLDDYLRRLSGVTVRGSGQNVTVFIHIANSLLNNSDPLFVVDGNVFNGNYNMLKGAINVMDIKSVSVYKKPAEVGIYGVRGVNGVIAINLK